MENEKEDKKELAHKLIDERGRKKSRPGTITVHFDKDGRVGKVEEYASYY